MRISLTGGSTKPASGLKLSPYTRLVTETQLTVGAVLVPIFTPDPQFNYLVSLSNSTAVGGVSIRVGIAPSFIAPIAGWLLEPKAGIIWDNWDGEPGTVFQAIASGAGGGTLEVSIWRTS